MNIRVLLLLLGCLCALSSQAQESKRSLWTWTDANGVTHFSDRPVPGARKVEIATPIPPPPRVATPEPATGAATQQRDAAAITYQRVEIWQPEQDESFFGADARVTVRIRTEPEVASRHSLVLFLDGQLIEAATNSTVHTLENLSRGAHSLIAVIADERGAELLRSQPRVFHIRQPTVNAPSAVGPNLRPPAPPPAATPVSRPRG